jgi:hypothetical protein
LYNNHTGIKLNSDLSERSKVSLWNESREIRPAEISKNGTLIDMTKKLRGISLLADNTPKASRNRKVWQTVLAMNEIF